MGALGAHIISDVSREYTSDTLAQLSRKSVMLPNMTGLVAVGPLPHK